MTVGEVRALNEVMPESAALRVLVCRSCQSEWSGDLARYWLPRDAEEFACSSCDGRDIFLRPVDHSVRFRPAPITQRFSAVAA